MWHWGPHLTFEFFLLYWTDFFPLGDDLASPESCLKIESISFVCVALADFILACNATTDKRPAQLLIRLHEMNTHIEGLLKDKGGGGKGGRKGKGGRVQNTDQTINVTVDDISSRKVLLNSQRDLRLKCAV